MESVATSRGGVPIRLTDERWQHIIDEHAELSGFREDVIDALSQADRVFAGGSGELLAMRMVEPEKALIVVYRESSATDGFVITAFFTRHLGQLQRREQIWPPPNSNHIST